MSAEESRPYRSLWSSVLRVAMQDAINGKGHERDEAVTFLRSRRALVVADLAGLDRDYLLRMLPDLLAGKVKLHRQREP